MEITTLIVWNGLVYLFYYGANIGIDYWRYSVNLPDAPTTYTYKELINESPKRVEAPGSTSNLEAHSEIVHQEPSSREFASPVHITGPVEDQGIPFDEFMKNSKHYSSNINF